MNRQFQALAFTALFSAGVLSAGTVAAAEAQREDFPGGRGAPVPAVVLTNHAGMKARIIAFGAALQELDTPDRDGKSADIVLSFPDMNGFREGRKYYGATIGRYANRIGGGKFTLDGQTYRLTVNDGPNSLHGGVGGFDTVVWTISDIHSGADASVTLTYVSKDGDQGYPGNLTASVTYTLTERNELKVAFEATTDRPTVVNLTNHSFFNLGGVAAPHDILSEQLTIFADNYTPVDATLSPTGEIAPVAGTPFDFRTPHEIGERIHDGSSTQIVYGRGYDHNFVLNGGVTAVPKLAARVVDARSGRVLELLTTEPGVQVYSGNFIDATSVGKGGQAYRQAEALCLEPQRFPDTPNKPNFPSARLNPGETYRHLSIFKFSVAPR